ncbi:MAG TPA: hypothetical protein DFS52_16580 [Myxococcales bacterium]|nr:hypothetical protein [Myxococcales bacterium]
MSRLLVAFDTRLSPRPSGVGIYTRDLLAALAARPELQVVAVASPQQPLPEGVERLATEIAFDAHGPAEYFEHVALPRQLAARKVELLHGPNTIVPAGRTPFARVVTIHDVAFARYGQTLTPAFRMLMRTRTRASLALADAAVAVSSFTADELRALYPRLATRVIALPSGTPEGALRHVRDPNRATARARELGLEPGRFLCAIGTLEPRKNLPTLLQAFAQAAIPGVKLALIGDRGWREGPLREALSRMPSDSVVLTGWLDTEQVYDLIASSAGLAYPSLYEGFGFPPLEALALGVNVACADLPPIRESCDGQVRLIGPLDLPGWVEALRWLVSSGPRPPWVGRRFSDVASELVEVYRVAVEGWSSRRKASR